MIRAVRAAAVLLVVLLSFGCGSPSGTPDVPAVVSYDVVLYFADQAYIETGDANLPPVVAEETAIDVPEGTEPFLAVLEALRTPAEADHATMVGEQISFHSVAYDNASDDLLVVDLAREGLTGGSLGEDLFIRQIVETLLHNEALAGDRPVPTRVLFLVDGQPAESLMGHIDATLPFESSL